MRFLSDGLITFEKLTNMCIYTYAYTKGSKTKHNYSKYRGTLGFLVKVEACLAQLCQGGAHLLCIVCCTPTPLTVGLDMVIPA